MARKKDSNHHMGKTTGYELINGEYHIAPVYRQQFDTLTDKRVAIEKMLQIVTRHVAEDLEQLQKQERRIWSDLVEDIGLDTNKSWQYRNLSGIVTEKKTMDDKQEE